MTEIKNHDEDGKQHAENRGGPKLGPLQRYVSATNSMPDIKLTKAMPAKA